ncbi:MAG: PEP-CTERM sorting domain-containing protein [Akkermansiaceae bacterium]|nr:PEP-CTERM sorting domain-containing protein [Akkermansiaceae bacterium]
MNASTGINTIIFEFQKLINPQITFISYAVVEEYKKDSDKLEEELKWMEWQANAIAPKILIPARTGRAKLNDILNHLTRSLTSTSRAYIMELAISEFADFFKVSTMAAKIRAIELGFDQAAGVFNYVDGMYYPPFSFKKGTLKKNQTFIIDRNNAIFESLLNSALADDFKNGPLGAGSGFLPVLRPPPRDAARAAETATQHHPGNNKNAFMKDWGVALLVSTTNPFADTYPGGFQFYLAGTRQEPADKDKFQVKLNNTSGGTYALTQSDVTSGDTVSYTLAYAADTSELTVTLEFTDTEGNTSTQTTSTTMASTASISALSTSAAGLEGWTLGDITVTATSAVPEPATATLGLLALGALALRRRRA